MKETVKSKPLGPFSFSSAFWGIIVFWAIVLMAWSPASQRPFNPKITDDTKRGFFLGLAKTPTRIAAVGEHGRIFYSSDDGKSWWYSHPPVDLPLTSIFFLNKRLGWAAGYDGVILKTIDGVSWDVVKKPLAGDPPLFMIWFKNEFIGLAIGADSTIYRTIDGGAHWSRNKLDTQAHLYSISEASDGAIWISGENHSLFHSNDVGIRWEKIEPPFLTSFFGSLPLPHHKMMTFGLRGRISVWDSQTGGLLQSQKVVDESLFAGIHLRDGRIVLAGQRGRILIGQAQGWPFRSLTIVPQQDIASLTEGTDALIFAGEFGLRRISKSELGL